MKYRGVLLISFLVLSGCTVSSPIQPVGKDTYMVASHVGACISCAASIQSLKTANEYCAQQGKVIVIRNTSSSTNPFGYETGNQLIFSCVSDSDPENARPELRKDDGVLTIDKR